MKDGTQTLNLEGGRKKLRSFLMEIDKMFIFERVGLVPVFSLSGLRKLWGNQDLVSCIQLERGWEEVGLLDR